MTTAEEQALKVDETTVYFTKKGPTKDKPSRITWHAHRAKGRMVEHSEHRTERAARAALGWTGGSDDPSFWPDDDYRGAT